MHIDKEFGKSQNGFRHIRLAESFKSQVDARIDDFRARAATLQELTAMEHKLRRELPSLARIEVLLRLRDHNSSIFQIVEEVATGRMVGFNAQLPLTEAGIDALKGGSFSASEPSTKHVAGIDAKVEAIYVWLTFSPRSFFPTVAGLSAYLNRFAPKGCSLFCTPVDEKTAAFLKKCGYEPAAESFPAAKDRLLVAHPLVRAVPQPVEPVNKPEDKIDVSVVRTLHEMAQIISIRAATYMFEQECPFEEEFDGNDFCATHLIGRINGEPAGCIRIRHFADFVKFERLAVRHEFRTSKLAFRLVRAAMKFAAQKGYKRVYGHSRHDLVRFWMTFGFRPIPGRPKFVFSDVEYVEMEGPIRLRAACVSVGDDPLRIIRPEGDWDKPGILERRVDSARLNRIGRKLDRPRKSSEDRRKAG